MAKKEAKEVVKTKKLPAKKVKQRDQVLRGDHGGMQLVLIEDVPYLGKQGDLVEVKLGYGRNYLLPKSLAVLPSGHNLRLLERYKIRVSQARESRIADIKVLADQIHRTARVTIEANSNEEGHLYGSVTAVEISRALKGKNLIVEPDMVKLADPIKECGIYAEVKLHLGYDIEAKVEVAVVPQATGKK
ncbi:MAG: 50S ribosomal protein L9 [Planctomycetes bacterium]|nr:50S ribosomal protein L9 [Planctomycetota bacterium]